MFFIVNVQFKQMRMTCLPYLAVTSNWRVQLNNLSTKLQKLFKLDKVSYSIANLRTVILNFTQTVSSQINDPSRKF